LAQNVPRTLDNTREFDPSLLTADPSTSTAQESSHSTLNTQPPSTELAADISSDPFASYFASTEDPSVPPKVLITTSPKATRVTYEFCDELVGVFPGAEFHKRPKGRGFEIGRIASWAATRGFSNLIVVNENVKKPSEGYQTVYLPALQY
jgi:ribosome production factor 1